MSRILGNLLLLAAAALPPGACASSYLGSATAVTPDELHVDDGWIVAEGVPFVAQEAREDCGAAALAMVLAYWEVPTTLAEVNAECPAQPEVGIKAGVIRDLVKRHGLQAFLIHGEVTDLEHELERGRPVLVGLAKQYSEGTYTHYEVVVGLNPGRGLIATIDPAHGWQQDTVAGFLGEWESVGRPAIVVFRSESPPRGKETGAGRSTPDVHYAALDASASDLVAFSGGANKQAVIVGAVTLVLVVTLLILFA